ncbi:hypothetical protein SRHO_G00124320 [Serrasalmus rhombeus]
MCRSNKVIKEEMKTSEAQDQRLKHAGACARRGRHFTESDPRPGPISQAVQSCGMPAFMLSPPNLIGVRIKGGIRKERNTRIGKGPGRLLPVI